MLLRRRDSYGCRTQTPEAADGGAHTERLAHDGYCCQRVRWSQQWQPTAVDDRKRTRTDVYQDARVVRKDIVKSASAVFQLGTTAIVLEGPGSGKLVLFKVLSGRFPVHDHQDAVASRVILNSQFRKLALLVNVAAMTVRVVRRNHPSTQASRTTPANS